MSNSVTTKPTIAATAADSLAASPAAAASNQSASPAKGPVQTHPSTLETFAKYFAERTARPHATTTFSGRVFSTLKHFPFDIAIRVFDFVASCTSASYNAFKQKYVKVYEIKAQTFECQEAMKTAAKAKEVHLKAIDALNKVNTTAEMEKARNGEKDAAKNADAACDALAKSLRRSETEVLASLKKAFNTRPLDQPLAHVHQVFDEKISEMIDASWKHNLTEAETRVNASCQKIAEIIKKMEADRSNHQRSKLQKEHESLVAEHKKATAALEGLKTSLKKAELLKVPAPVMNELSKLDQAKNFYCNHKKLLNGLGITGAGAVAASVYYALSSPTTATDTGANTDTVASANIDSGFSWKTIFGGLAG